MKPASGLAGGKLWLGIAAATGVTAAIGAVWMLKARKMTKSKSTEDIIKELIAAISKEHVHMKDTEKVHDMLKEMIEGGKDGLQVIADFDRTLSKYKSKGQLSTTCHCVLQNSPRLPEAYIQENKKLFNTYYPIETDSSLTLPEKVPYMVEWWTKAHKLLEQVGLRRQTLIQIVRESNLPLRDGCNSMFLKLYKSAVPLLIFSAGLGDIIEEVIRAQSKLYSNIKIVSNYMDFNHQGVMVGFKGELLHVFNKNENAIHRSSYFNSLKHRGNILLMGDSLGDLQMAEGADNANICLKIGFLNDKVDEKLATYMESYDIVIETDESMDIPNAIINSIL